MSSLMRACKMINDHVQTRLPLQRGMVELIITHTINLVDTENGQPYLSIMYQAAFAAAYYGMLRISEISSGEHPIKAVDVHIANNKKKMLFVLRSSKTHGRDVKPQTVKICGGNNGYRITKNRKYCPFEILQEYVKNRPTCRNINEPFFIFSDRSPVKPTHLRQLLKTILKRIGVDPSLYGFHSFRIGRGTDLYSAKISVETIRKLGRWRSGAVYSYLR